MVNDVVDASEMVGRLNDIIHIYGFISDTYCIGFKDVSCLFVCELAALDMIGVVCEVYLCAVVDATI